MRPRSRLSLLLGALAWSLLTVGADEPPRPNILFAIAPMYSVPNPTMIQPVLPLLSPKLRCWLTVRNDDIHSFRWADVEYARAFIKAIPES